MAAPMKNKVDLRQLMKKQRTEVTSTRKRIESPLAKYNNIDQLVCVVCNTVVKSELIWPAHIQGKKHKENVAQLKAKTTPNRTDTFVKPTAPQVIPTSSAPAKRKSDAIDDSQTVAKKTKDDNVPTNTKFKGLPIDFFDDDSDSSEDEAEAPIPVASSTSKLPADFFDSSVSSKPTTEENASTSEDKGTTSADAAASMAEALPEGFFDDPIMDAKVRKVEVKDPMTEEWEKFKKSIAEETNVSEAIQEEEDDERQRERQIDEIDEQIHCLQKVENLRDKKEEIRTKTTDKSGTADEEDSSSVTEEAEFEEFLDWRSKGAWR